MATRKFVNADRVRLIVGNIMIVIGFGSLLVWRPPLELAFLSAAIGVISAVFWLTANTLQTEESLPHETKLRLLRSLGRRPPPTQTILDFVGALVFALGIQYATDWADTFGPRARWWQPGLLAVGTSWAVYLLSLLVRGLHESAPNGAKKV